MVLNLFFTFTLFQNFSLFAGPYFCKKQTRMKERILPYLALFAFLATGSYFAFASKGAAAPPATRPRDPEMLAAAKGFLGSLTGSSGSLPSLLSTMRGGRHGTLCRWCARAWLTKK